MCVRVHVHVCVLHGNFTVLELPIRYVAVKTAMKFQLTTNCHSMAVPHDVVVPSHRNPPQTSICKLAALHSVLFRLIKRRLVAMSVNGIREGFLSVNRLFL